MAAAREILGGLAGVGERAMPALALKEQGKGGSWEPVGEESMYAFVDESPGFVLTDTSGSVLALVDAGGRAKAVVQGVTARQKELLGAALEAGGVREFKGRVTLPV